MSVLACLWGPWRGGAATSGHAGSIQVGALLVCAGVGKCNTLRVRGCDELFSDNTGSGRDMILYSGVEVSDGMDRGV